MNRESINGDKMFSTSNSFFIKKNDLKPSEDSFKEKNN